MTNERVLLKKLQTAVNRQFDVKIVLNTVQFYSDKENRPINIYSIKQKTKNGYTELYKSSSLIQLLLFIRDYWYILNNWDLPHDNEMWEQIRKVKGLWEQEKNQ